MGTNKIVLGISAETITSLKLPFTDILFQNVGLTAAISKQVGVTISHPSGKCSRTLSRCMCNRHLSGQTISVTFSVYRTPEMKKRQDESYQDDENRKKEMRKEFERMEKTHSFKQILFLMIGMGLVGEEVVAAGDQSAH